jgi:hypothetical protein
MLRLAIQTTILGWLSLLGCLSTVNAQCPCTNPNCNREECDPPGGVCVTSQCWLEGCGVFDCDCGSICLHHNPPCGGTENCNCGGAPCPCPPKCIAYQHPFLCEGVPNHCDNAGCMGIPCGCADTCSQYQGTHECTDQSTACGCSELCHCPGRCVFSIGDCAGMTVECWCGETGCPPQCPDACVNYDTTACDQMGGCTGAGEGFPSWWIMPDSWGSE